MTDLAVWKIRKVLRETSYAERTCMLERYPEYRDKRAPILKQYQKERRKVMSFFIMIVWKGRRVRSGLDMLVLV